MFSDEARMVGDRICNIDLDVILLEDITALLTTKTAPFVGWSDERFAWNKIAGGIWLLTTGAHPEVWERFDPATSPQMTWTQGHRGSDQAWLSHMLYPPLQRFTSQDGVWKLRWLPTGQAPGPDVRLVFTTGVTPPWSPQTQREHPWIRDYFHGERSRAPRGLSGKDG